MLYNVDQRHGRINPDYSGASSDGDRGQSQQQRSYIVATTGTGLSYASFLVGRNRQGQLHAVSAAGVRRALPRDLTVRPGQLEGELETHPGSWPAVRLSSRPSQKSTTRRASSIPPDQSGHRPQWRAAHSPGTAPGTCNCSTPVNNYYKNFGPRLGLAYQLGSKTVIRASYGVMFSHGDAVGGLAPASGRWAFAAAPSFSSTNGSLLSTIPDLQRAATERFRPTRRRRRLFGCGLRNRLHQQPGYTGTPLP